MDARRERNEWRLACDCDRNGPHLHGCIHVYIHLFACASCLRNSSAVDKPSFLKTVSQSPHPFPLSILLPAFLPSGSPTYVEESSAFLLSQCNFNTHFLNAPVSATAPAIFHSPADWAIWHFKFSFLSSLLRRSLRQVYFLPICPPLPSVAPICIFVSNCT